MNVVIIHGSHRPNRMSVRAARYMQKAYESRDCQVAVVDSKAENLNILEKMYKEYPAAEAPDNLARLAGLFKAADLFVVVSGEYNHGVQPGLSNLLDHFLEEYFFRPSAIVSYSAGRIAGMRSAMALRPMLGEMGMPSVPAIFGIGPIQKLLDEDGVNPDGELDKRLPRFLDETLWYAEALKAQREKGLPY